MLGLAGQGQEGDGRHWNASTGQGYVAPRPGHYAHALSKGVEVVPMLFETFGGFSPDFMDLLHSAGAAVENRLSSSQYEQTTWSARSWMSFSAQRISVALHRAAAWEIVHALDVRGVSAGEDLQPGEYTSQ